MALPPEFHIENPKIRVGGLSPRKTNKYKGEESYLVR
jgi:hypothetical protein